VKSYGQFCPVAKACEVFAERWTPLIIRELCAGSVRFNDLRRGVPLMSPSLLSRRLKELEHAGVVVCTRSTDGRSTEYHLTEAGRELEPVIDRLGVWGKRWTRAVIEKRDLDAGYLMWSIRGSVRPGAPPSRRTVVRFDFTGTSSGKRVWWLVFEDGDVELCLLDPGFDVDLEVRTHLRTMTALWLGDTTWDVALGSGELAIEGPAKLVRAFPRWFEPSPIANVARRV
jgi:DNA-binding HxlR family transcriptional regulator